MAGVSLIGYTALKPCQLGGVKLVEGEECDGKIRIDHSAFLAAVRGGRIAMTGSPEERAATARRVAAAPAPAKERKTSGGSRRQPAKSAEEDVTEGSGDGEG
jgi:hypothetical protein